MRDVMRKLVPSVLVGWLLSGCGRPAPGTEEPMGSGGSCEDHLAAIVDERYLLDDGVEIEEGEGVDAQIVEAIATVCDEGPASMSIGDGAQRVVAVVSARTTSH